MNKLLALLAAACLAASTYATPIVGSLAFTGSYTPNNDLLDQATLIAFDDVYVSAIPKGSFATSVAKFAPVTMFTPLVINQPGVVLPATAIWSVGGFSLNLNSLVETDNDTQVLTLKGMGMISHVDFTPTPGDWVATFNRSGEGSLASFSFSATSASVPDGGMTALLLGISLVGMSLIARRRKTA